jgi:rhodanese-related sulfurtransferase
MRRVATILCSLVLTVLAAGCGSDDSPASAGTPGSGSAVVIDVRTPAEFAAGHLDGARNIDSASATLETDLKALDLDGEYQLYCRSGARAGAVLQLMKDLGFTNVTNLGSLEKAADATGMEIVK